MISFLTSPNLCSYAKEVKDFKSKYILTYIFIKHWNTAL